MVVAALRQRRIRALICEAKSRPAKPGRFFVFSKIELAHKLPNLDNEQRLAMSLWSAWYGEGGGGRNELRGSPQGVLGGRQTVAGVRDRWRYSNNSRQATGWFFGPGYAVREGRQKNCRSRDQLRPAREATTFSSE